MRNLVNVGRALMVVGALTISACSSSGSGSGTGGTSGSGGATGTGGAGAQDAGTGGADGGAGGADGGGAGGSNAHQDHLNIINKATTGGITVTRPAPAIPYDTCKI